MDTFFTPLVTKSHGPSTETRALNPSRCTCFTTNPSLASRLRKLPTSAPSEQRYVDSGLGCRVSGLDVRKLGFRRTVEGFRVQGLRCMA